MIISDRFIAFLGGIFSGWFLTYWYFKLRKRDDIKK